MKISIDVGRSADARTGNAHGSTHQRFVHFLVDDHALDVACLGYRHDGGHQRYSQITLFR